jgi:hypothetical protein
MRIQPRPSLAWAIGIDYDKIGTTTDTIVKGIVVPVAIGSLVLVVVTTLLGWWRPVLRELPTDPPRPPRWLLVVPILVFIASETTTFSRGAWVCFSRRSPQYHVAWLARRCPSWP